MKFANRIAIASITIGMMACATPSEVRDNAPILSATSGKTAKDVTGCLADKMEILFKSMEVNSRPTAKGYAISVTGNVSFGRDTAVVIDIDDVKTGSKTTVYSHLLKGDGAVIKIANDCQ